MVTRLADRAQWRGSLPPADDLWLIGHHETSGEPRLHSRPLGLGLAGALLAELVLGSRITIVDERVRVLRSDPPPDSAAHSVLEQLIAEPGADLSRWLRVLAVGADEVVMQRLVVGGFVTGDEVRRRWRTTVVFRPTDRTGAAWRGVRLRSVLNGDGPEPTWSDVVLAAVVEAVGLLPDVLWDGRATGETYLRRAMRHADPPIRALVAAVATQVGDAILHLHT
jgi:hypothetical protein